MPLKKMYKRKGRKTQPKTNIKSLVRSVAKKVVAQSLEDKYETRLSQSNGYPRLYDSPITSNDIYPLLPAISQGPASNERIGDKIRPKRMRVDFTLATNQGENSSLLVNTRLFILEDKSIKASLQLAPIAGVQPGSPIGTELLQYGNTLQGFTGLPSDDMARVNRERYNVIKEVRKEMQKAVGQGPIVSNSYIGGQTFVTSQSCYKFSVVIPTPAVLKYSNATDTFPSNFAPFFVLGYTQPDGNAAGSSLLQRIALGYVCHLDYEDA